MGSIKSADESHRMEHCGKTMPSERIPLAAGLIGISTVLFTLFSHISKGLQPPVPTISMTSYRPVSLEFFVFNIGLTTSAALLVMSAAVVHLRFNRTGWLGRVALWSGLIAAGGMVITSSVPLQPDIMEILARPREERRFNTQSDLHMKAANVFFISALVHAISSTIKLTIDRRAAASRGAPPVVSSASYWTKCVTVGLACCFIVSPLLLFMYPRIIKTSRVTIVALNQYGAVLSLLVFFTSYTIDLRGYHISLWKSPSVDDARDGKKQN